jgi:3-mercaptopyruvate sulfurtransferase SseA
MLTSTRRLQIPILLIILGIIFILSAVVLNNTFQRDDSVSTNPVTQVSQESGLSRVSLDDAKAAFDSQQAVFVDVRDASSYAEHHIPGAVSIPLVDLEARIGELDQDEWIITYCT